MNLERASEFAALASAAYASPMSVDPSEYHHFEKIYSDERRTDNTLGFLVTRNDDVLVIFRGTQGINEWILNLLFRPEAKGLGNIHRGFGSPAQAALEQIETFCRRMRSETGKIYLAGHSRGGALAVITAYLLAEQGISYPVSEVYTFGAPRVGDSGFALLYKNLGLNARTFQFVTKEDLVPRVPMRQPYGYLHVGSHYVVDDDMQVLDVDGLPPAFPSSKNPKEVLEILESRWEAHALAYYANGLAPSPGIV